MTQGNWTRRSFIKRSGVAAAAVVGGPVLLSSCSTGSDQVKSLDDAKDKDKLVLGISGEIPFAYKQGSKITGEGPEVARAVLAELGIKKIDAQQVKFDALIPGLKRGDYDMVAAGMFITPERCKEVLFSDPDYVSQTAFIVKKGNPKNITDFASVAKAGITMGTGKGYAEIDFAKDAKVAEKNIKILPDSATMWNELESGKVQAITATRSAMQALLDQHAGAAFELSQPFFPTLKGQPQKPGGGMAFHPDSKGFRDAFNKKLDEMKQAKKIYPIVQPFKFTQQEIDEAIPLKASSFGCKD